ncbi:MAG: hypothetical protein O6926_11780 [candidate division NC10 bacterium]|nr:hypothetical protein [candidate division NC10 bacterium]
MGLTRITLVVDDSKNPDLRRQTKAGQSKKNRQRMRVIGSVAKLLRTSDREEVVDLDITEVEDITEIK